MYRNFIFCTALAGVFLLAVSAFASNGTQLGTVGARGTAMGSATRGLADDWSAFFFNPAGLSQIPGTTLGISYGLIAPTGTYKPAPLPDTPFSGMATDSRDLKKQTFQVPAIGLFFKPIEKLTLGVGLMAPFGLGAKFDLFELPANYGNIAGSLPEQYETNSDHEVAFFQPTLAYEVTDRLSIGLGVGYTERGSMVLNQVGLPKMEVMAPQTVPLFTLLSLTGALNPDHRRIVAVTSLDGKGHAWTFSVGAHYKLSEALRLGVAGRFYTPLKLSGTLTTTAYLPGLTPQTAAAYQASVEGYVQSLVAAGQLPPDRAAATVQQYMTGIVQAFPGNVTLPDGSTPGIQVKRSHAEADLKLPATIGGGVAYKPFQRLTLTADVSWTHWAAWDTIEVHLQYQEQKSKAEMVEEWANTLEIGIGAEYRVIDGDRFKLDLRGGGYTAPSPVPVHTINPTILDPNRRFVFTGGLGLTYRGVSFSVAFEHVLLGEKTIGPEEYVIDPTGMNENWPGVYNMAANVVTFGITLSR